MRITDFSHGGVMMKPQKRMIFGIIAASVSDIAQRELLVGIIEQAEKHNIDIAVISNIYNENCGDRELPFENVIYDLLSLSDFDGFIMLSEPFPCVKLRNKIHNILCEKKVPLVIAGAAIPDFSIPDARHIGTNDETDMEEVVDHLIDEHGFKNIDFLTGYDSIEASHLRLNGYKKSLEKHGIPFDESKVIFGDFWTESGKRLAMEYIEGKRPYPEAAICTNDYMAFGMLDEFERSNINILDFLAVTGFDFSMMRNAHSPLLTSYRFNRTQLGRDAVRILYNKIRYDIDEDFQPPKGSIIHGISCQCSFLKTKLNEELEYVRSNQQYEQWSLDSNMEQKITSCRTLDELFATVGEFQFLVRYVQDIFICLYDNWYEYKPDKKSENLTCRSIMPWLDTSPFSLNVGQIMDIFQRSETPAAYYYSPLTFDKRLFGYVILKYDNPDTYDYIFKNWIKSVANGLEFLRLKHDISYLLECQSPSKTQDTLTALKNDYGMKKAFDEAIHIYDNNKKMYFIMLKCCLFHDVFDDIAQKNKISSLLDISDALNQFASIQNGVCGRINDATFLCILNKNDMSAEQLEDHLISFVTQHKTYLAFYGINSFLYCILPLSKNDSYTDLKQKCFENINKQINDSLELNRMNHYDRMLEIRNEFYLNTQKEFSTEYFCQKYSFSPSYLRVTYKKFFGFSLLQDFINSRIYRAKYLLLTTDMKIKEISNDCGYHDTKYFLRQFLNRSGLTPNQYREKHGNCILLKD